ATKERATDEPPGPRPRRTRPRAQRAGREVLRRAVPPPPAHLPALSARRLGSASARHPRQRRRHGGTVATGPRRGRHGHDGPLSDPRAVLVIPGRQSLGRRNLPPVPPVPTP